MYIESTSLLNKLIDKITNNNKITFNTSLSDTQSDKRSS